MTKEQPKKTSFLKTDGGKLIAVAAVAGSLIAASFGVTAVADSKTFQHAKLFVTSSVSGDENPFMHKASWGGRGFFGGHRRGDWANLSDEDVEKRISRIVRHAAIEIDANDEQTRKITALLAAVAKDMRPLRNEFRDAGKEMRKLLLADNVDREALEKLRSERMAKADEVSRELMKAAADVAEVLTPDQRKVVEKRIGEFRKWRGRRHRG